jgi:serine/threonine protein phosphatase PrpC
VYPGGLVLTRSVGNVDASDAIMAVPDTSTTAVPGEGARLVLASNGLWNALGNLAVGVVCKRAASPAACVDTLMEVRSLGGNCNVSQGQKRGGVCTNVSSRC